MFCQKGVLKKFAKFTGKLLYQSLFFDKVAGLRPATLLKRILWHRCFHVNFANFLRILFFIKHFLWFLLTIEVCESVSPKYEKYIDVSEIGNHDV